MEDEINNQNGHDAPMDNDDDVQGSAALRPIFLGNLNQNFTSEDVMEIFERPIQPAGQNYKPFPVDRVDLKRGYCFVFLKDAVTQEDKEAAERFVVDINGMEVPNVSPALRVEFARGDGRVKRKEDDRRKRIQPSDTLFVVNFQESTTKREDLKMLFEPYGELVRVEMKRNYAFVQFKSVEEATRAKEEVNGGKLDQSVLTVEYVAQQRNDEQRRSRDRGRGGDRRPRRDYDRPRDYDSRRRSPPPRDYDYRRRSPPRYRRSRSRSPRSPPRYRSRSPPRRDYDRYDDRGRNDDRGRYDDRDSGRGDRDRDRGYRP